MSGKREASYTIDPNTLEATEKDPQENGQSETNGAKVPKEERKIFKIKRPGQADGDEHKQTKVAFKLNQSQLITPSAEDYKATPPKQQGEKAQTAPNPFANLFKSENVFNGIGIFSNPNSTNLFTSNKGTQQSSKSTANIFGGANIFASKGPSIFDNSSSIKNTSASLFSKNQAANDDDGSGDSAELQEAQNLQADPQKSKVSYSYDDSCIVLLTLKVAKFKKSGGDLIENVEIVLQKQKETNIKYIIVRLPATKKSIFSGVLVEGRSDVKHIHGKKQNVEVGAFYKEKDAFTKTYLKFQFENSEDGEKLYERLEELVAISKQQDVKADEAKEKKE